MKNDPKRDFINDLTDALVVLNNAKPTLPSREEIAHMVDVTLVAHMDRVFAEHGGAMPCCGDFVKCSRACFHRGYNEGQRSAIVPPMVPLEDHFPDPLPERFARARALLDLAGLKPRDKILNDGAMPLDQFAAKHDLKPMFPKVDPEPSEFGKAVCEVEAHNEATDKRRRLELANTLSDNCFIDQEKLQQWVNEGRPWADGLVGKRAMHPVGMRHVYPPINGCECIACKSARKQ